MNLPKRVICRRLPWRRVINQSAWLARTTDAAGGDHEHACC